MVLYKYSQAKWGIAILRELRLRVTPPNEFNDPFELTPTTSNPLNMKEELNAYLQSQGVPSSVESANKVAQALKETSQIASGLGENLSRTDMSSLAEASKVLGVLCLSEPVTDIRMWAYYGDSHRGLAIGLDFEQESEEVPILYFKPVRYGEKRASQNPFLAVDENSDAQAMEAFEEQQLNMVLTKSKEWKDEREHRIVCKLSDLQKELRGPKGSDGFNYFLHIRPKTIREVVMGCWISEEDEATVMSICKAKVPHADIIRLERHSTDFKLVPKPA